MRELVFECSQSKPPYPIRLAVTTIIRSIWLFLKKLPNKAFPSLGIRPIREAVCAPSDALPISMNTRAAATLCERARSRISHSVIIFKQTHERYPVACCKQDPPETRPDGDAPEP
jgi:hypothetical protein